MPITPLYAAILGLIFVALSLQTIRLRRRHRVALGDGDHAPLRQAMRVHANFAAVPRLPFSAGIRRG
ncbi:MAG: MAPEG family protein [Burkholderiales bacterium]|nr:MAPEG family protein [Burkholderiales bacterium]MDP2398500.1 MAPEG family protein [Burkholderiales bacterium]MDP3714869.1 MAPEG family protein [Burkholderiales bacterium]